VRDTPTMLKAANASKDAVETIDKTNKMLLRIILGSMLIVILLVGGFLAALINTIDTNHGVSCQTNMLVRSLDTDVNALRIQVEQHKKPVLLIPITAPKGCQ
jgi:hypothetical protein